MTDAALDTLVREVRALFNDGWDNPSDLRLRALLADVVEKADAFDLMETGIVRLYKGTEDDGDMRVEVITLDGKLTPRSFYGPTLLDAVRAYRKAREG